MHPLTNVSHQKTQFFYYKKIIFLEGDHKNAP